MKGSDFGVGIREARLKSPLQREREKEGREREKEGRERERKGRERKKGRR